MDASERREVVAGTGTFWQKAPVRTAEPVLHVHGVPTDGDDFLPFLERTGGIALDLPGFGRSDKPAEFDYSIDGYRHFLAGFVDHLDLERFSLVVHDWGAAALALAQDRPERVERLVIMNAVPLLPGYRWHRAARAWRTPVLGELAMGLTTRRTLGLISREANVSDGPLPPEFLDRVWERFDHGTQRAILRLYRSAPEHVLASWGERLGALRCPSLVLWGAQDPYLPSRLAEAYAAALGGEARLELVEGAGHWCWLDRPEIADSVAEFLLA